MIFTNLEVSKGLTSIRAWSIAWRRCGRRVRQGRQGTTTGLRRGTLEARLDPRRRSPRLVALHQNEKLLSVC